MILSYNWQIIQNEITCQQDLIKCIKVPQPLAEDLFASQQSPNNSIQPACLRSPSFGFVFSYFIEEPKTCQPQIEIVPEVTMYEQALRLRIVRQLRTKNCIYLQLLLQNSEMYDNLLFLTAKVRYHSQDKLQKINSVDRLIKLAANRQLNLYTATTYSTIKQEIIVESPVAVQYRCEKEGYLWMKLIRPQENIDEVQVKQVQIMNWLANGPESLKKEVVTNLVRGSFKLKNKESYALLFKLNTSIIGIEVPYSITFSFPQQSKIFKLVKYLKGDQPRYSTT